MSGSVLCYWLKCAALAGAHSDEGRAWVLASSRVTGLEGAAVSGCRKVSWLQH